MLIMESSIWDNRREALRTELKAARKAKDITQDEVALKLGVSQSFVSKYESGERRLDLFDLIDVCEAIGVDWVKLTKTVLKSS